MAAQPQVVKATAALKLGRCLYGRGTFHGGCGADCSRFKKMRGKKDLCTCGHGAEWHEVGGVSVVLTETDVRDAFARFRTRLEEEVRVLEGVVLRGISKPAADDEERKANVCALEAAGLLSPEDAVAASSNGVFKNGAEVRAVANEIANAKPIEIEGNAPSAAAFALAATLSAYGPSDRRTLLVRAVYSFKTKNVQTALSWLRRTGWLLERGDVVELADGAFGYFVTQEARDRVVALGGPLLAAWCRKLTHAAAVVLRTLAAAGSPMSRGEVADATAHHGGPEGGYSLATKNFQSALSRLVSLGLVTFQAEAGGFLAHPDLVGHGRGAP